MTEIRDFTKKRKPIIFREGDDVFHAAPGLPAQVMLEFATRFQGMSIEATVDQQLEAFTSVLEIALLPESYKRFAERMADRENPIEIDQIEEIITWLMEQYGLRPTALPSVSSDGQPAPEPGTTSTASTPDVVSISAASPQTAS
jgi:hypothetical protein